MEILVLSFLETGISASFFCASSAPYSRGGSLFSEGGEGGNTSSNSSSSETSVYSGNGGDESPYVKKEISPGIEGVLIIAEGGDDAVVIENITEAVQALFGVDTHKIKVMKHN